MTWWLLRVERFKFDNRDKKQEEAEKTADLSEEATLIEKRELV